MSLGRGGAGPVVSRHCGSIARAEPTWSACDAVQTPAKCVPIPSQTAGGTWERPRVSFHNDRDRGGEGQGRGHSAPSPPWESSPSKTAVFQAELPEKGQAHPSRRPGLIQDLSILGWHLGNGSCMKDVLSSGRVFGNPHSRSRLESIDREENISSHPPPTVPNTRPSLWSSVLGKHPLACIRRAFR